LIKAFIMTPLWGGQPGSRPAFLVTGPDRDEHQGRGIGKTTLIQIMADEIFGGAFKARQSKDFDDMVTRLLSREARQKRIALLDNVKTFNFSWGDMEDLITSSVISGRQLYVGDGTRPNYLVWAITLNGASLGIIHPDVCPGTSRRNPCRRRRSPQARLRVDYPGDPMGSMGSGCAGRDDRPRGYPTGHRGTSGRRRRG
jgi:hypothetical protein